MEKTSGVLDFICLTYWIGQSCLARCIGSFSEGANMALQSVVSISVEGVELFVASDRVREVLGTIAVVGIPGGPRGLVGITTWTSRVIAVLDVASLVGVGSTASRPRTLVVEAGTALLAIPVDSVREPREVERTRPAHATRTSFVDVEIEAGGLVGPLLDLDAAVREFSRHES